MWEAARSALWIVLFSMLVAMLSVANVSWRGACSEDDRKMRSLSPGMLQFLQLDKTVYQTSQYFHVQDVVCWKMTVVSNTRNSVKPIVPMLFSSFESSSAITASVELFQEISITVYRLEVLCWSEFSKSDL